MIQPVTTGDLLHLIGGFGSGIDYTVRLSLRLKDPIDGAMLADAVGKTQQRFPYLSLRLFKDALEFYFEPNPAPVKVVKRRDKATLNSEDSNYHLWAVCYEDDYLFLDVAHGICDGTGMYMLLSTLLYYYCNLRYGVTDHTGIRTLEDPVKPEEYSDPLDHLPQVDLSGPQPEAAFTLLSDGGLTPCEPLVYDIAINEASLLQHAFSNDASPGTLVLILFCRAIDRLYPERNRPLTTTYIYNARPMLGAPETHHNCAGSINFTYTDPISAMPLERQCTIHRGTTFVQSDEEIVQGTMTGLASLSRILKAQPVEGQKQAFGQILLSGRQTATTLVSYIGQWKRASLAPYIEEFWTHVPNTSSELVTEIAAVNGKFFLSVHQMFKEDCVVKAFLEQLEDANIGYEIRETMGVDIARIMEPASTPV